MKNRDSNSPVFLWALLALGGLGYVGLFVSHPEWLLSVGVNSFSAPTAAGPRAVWFLDSFAILASNDALARGLDVYAANPLDYLQRPHVYSEWWLVLGKLGLTRADNFKVGFALVAVFFAVALARLRPKSVPQFCWYLAILCSSPVLLAVHRANNDLLIFIVLAGVVPCLVSAHAGMRFLAAGLIALAAGLKFYPAAALLLLLASGPVSRRAVKIAAGIAVCAVALVFFTLRADFVRMSALLPSIRAEGLMTFGAANLLNAFGLEGTRAMLTGAALAVAGVAWFFRRPVFHGDDDAFHRRSEWLSFVLGAVLLTNCFFSGVNFAYRWVFALWLAPFLWLTWREGESASLRKFAGVTAGLLLVALWADAFAAFALTRLAGHSSAVEIARWADRFFLLEQPVTWAFFLCLLGWIIHFVRTEFPRLLLPSAS